MILMSIRFNFDTRKVQKYVKCKEIDLWGGQNHILCYFIRNMGLRRPILHQSRVQISYDGFCKQLEWFSCQKSLILTPGRCKNTSNSRKLIFEGVKITFYVILTVIWDLDSIYCTNLEYKSVMIVQKKFWMTRFPCQ